MGKETGRLGSHEIGKSAVIIPGFELLVGKKENGK